MSTPRGDASHRACSHPVYASLLDRPSLITPHPLRLRTRVKDGILDTFSAVNKNSKIFKYFRMFSNIFKRFAPFFESFQTFSNVSILPILPNRYILTHQSSFLTQKLTCAPKFHPHFSCFFQIPDVSNLLFRSVLYLFRCVDPA